MDNISFSHEEILKVEEFAASQKSSVLVIFFDDMKGSSLIKQEMAKTEGEDAFQKLRQEHDQVLSQIIKRDQVGEVIKSTGDGLLAVFTEPTTAVQRALEIQAYYQNHSHIQLRIGLDMGQVRIEKLGGVQKDMFGRHVDWAARAEAMSDGGHILVTEAVYNDAFDWLKRKLVSWKTHGYYFLKPGERPIALFEPYNANITQPMDHPKGNRSNGPILIPPNNQSGGDRVNKNSRSAHIKMIAISMVAIFILIVVGINQTNDRSGDSIPKISTLSTVNGMESSTSKIPDDAVEFDFSNPILIDCSSNDAVHEVTNENDKIHWVWHNKKSIYCGWFFDQIPLKVFTRNFVLNYHLKILYTGSYSGSPSPQIKFVDHSGHATALLDFSKYEKKTSENLKIIIIPMSDFIALDGSSTFKVNLLQFDTGWDSPDGDIVIQSVTFIKAK